MDYFPVSLIRSIRNTLLQKSDVKALPDYPHPDEATRQAWLDYRQALRDVTKTMEVNEDGTLARILSVQWPAEPSSS
jgi:hypothetical protein